MIAFNSLSHDGDGGYDVYVMNADGSDQAEADAQRDAFTPGRPTGGRSPSTADGDIYVMNADGSGQRRLTRTQAYDRNPAWSPDGRKLAFGGNGHDLTS